MNRLVRNHNRRQFNYYFYFFSWGYYYFSAGYLAYKKIVGTFPNESNIGVFA